MTKIGLLWLFIMICAIGGIVFYLMDEGNKPKKG